MASFGETNVIENVLLRLKNTDCRAEKDRYVVLVLCYEVSEGGSLYLAYKMGRMKMIQMLKSGFSTFLITGCMSLKTLLFFCLLYQVLLYCIQNLHLNELEYAILLN